MTEDGQRGSGKRAKFELLHTGARRSVLACWARMDCIEKICAHQYNLPNPPESHNFDFRVGLGQ